MSALDNYRALLEAGTFDGQDWSSFDRRPLSRFHTFQRAFELFRQSGGHVVVELGTIRSFTHGGLPSCNTDDRSAWTPTSPRTGIGAPVASAAWRRKPRRSDAGDCHRRHRDRSSRALPLVTAPFAALFTYTVADSREFLRDYPGSIDLLYLDTGDITPIDPTAELQLAEARILVERELVPIGGVLLIDDVQHPTPRACGDLSGLGKANTSLAFLLAHGFRLDMREFQYVLVRER